jgi:hypothetical protein
VADAAGLASFILAAPAVVLEEALLAVAVALVALVAEALAVAAPVVAGNFDCIKFEVK